MQIVVCPACSTRIKIKPGVSGKFACPKCQKVLRVKAQTDEESPPEESSAPSPVIRAQPKQPAQPNQPPAQPKQPSARPVQSSQDDFLSQLPSIPSPVYDPLATSTASYKPTAAPRKVDSSFKGYLKKLGIGLGILCTVILLTMPLLAYPRSAVCLVPIMLVALSILVLVFWGRIWFIVLGFQQSTAQGFLVMLVPYYWLFFLVKNKEKCLKPLVTMGACLVPALFGVVIDRFFKPDFAGANRGASLQLSSSQLAGINKDLADAAAQAGPNDLVTAKFDIFTIMNNGKDVATAAEQALARLPGYKAGSFKLAADNKSLTLQYRGTRRDLAMRYGLVLPGEAGIMLNLTPRFD